MKKSDDRRRQVLAFIQARVEADGRPPTLDEIATACGFASRSAAQKHVRALEDSGDLEVTRGRSRGARPKKSKPTPQSAQQLFEIAPRDVGDLSDTDLRGLVARLCIARLADAELPPIPVTWGGDQRAPDGGIDVRVQLSDQDAKKSHFERSVVGFQVKATKMGLSEIQKEMCPGGVLRSSIRELVQRNGAYIIATSDTVADAEYQRRVGAMKAAVAGEAEAATAFVDYYDARRLADWTNRHPGVVAWVLSQLGRALQGWRPYGQWSNTRDGKAQPFLPDEKHRLFDPHDRENGLTLTDGLRKIRSMLRTGGTSIRLTGLSGVGKTRFAQALFEEEAAPEALPQSHAIYTDTGEGSNPTPLALLDELLASRRRAVLVVDNCGSDLHSQLTARCKISDRVSLLTIEYDIREDLPLETSVFQLDAASPDLIAKVIEQQFPHISQVNAQTITEFADGNSRVAIALANTMGSNDSLAGLTDRALFDRLFWLGKEVHRELKVAAEACSLVYSFDGEDLEGELSALSALAGLSPLTLYRHVNDLQQRGLAQRRGKWRAILPHAIANPLAAQALESIPHALLHAKLVAPQGRLLRSFSRRLGYLHTSPSAKRIASSWLAEDGLLGDLAGLSPFLLEVLSNIAPVSPAETLSAIKRAVEGPAAAQLLSAKAPSRTSLVRLVRSIAYEAEHFNECLSVLVAFASTEAEDERMDPTRSVIKSLFTLYLSGTHATTEQRANWIRGALESGDAVLGKIGLEALDSCMEAHHFSSSYEFEFGARVRDYGYHPRGKAIHDWFATFINLAAEVATGSGPWVSEARDLLAKRFRALWSFAGMADVLESVSERLIDSGWERGWLAIRQTIQFDKKSLRAEALQRLKKLEERSRPKTLVARVKATVLANYAAGLDYADGEDDVSGYELAEVRAKELGELVGNDPAAFDVLLPLLVTNQQGRHWSFGRGLADAVESLSACWAEMTKAFEDTPDEQRNVQVLRGFLHAMHYRDRDTFESCLDEAMGRAALAPWVPVLQLSAPLDESGCSRLLASMDNPAITAWAFQHLAIGRATEHLSDDLLARLLQKLSIKPDGLSVAIDVLYMHIHGNDHPIGPCVTAVAHTLIANAYLASHRGRLDHELSGVIKKFLCGPEGESTARTLLSKLRQKFEDHALSRYDLTETIAALFKVQPHPALDALVGDEDGSDNRYMRRHELAGGRRSSALTEISIDALMDWCRAGSPQRWTRVASLLPAFAVAESGQTPKWSERVMTLLQNSPDPVAVGAELVELVEPSGWSGSRAEAIRQRLPLLDQLTDALGPENANAVASWRSRVLLTIDRETRRELEAHKARNERFE
ncbi:hypothetical protein [Diaphorobacter nitroreducens]|uniref:LexA family protein n=1 Tax=Diaphorobacter nitroreducens TaxID=164759 RepID=UPI000B59B2EA|nr:hypothetical protein [Diaphorobacter nitroreducens]